MPNLQTQGQIAQDIAEWDKQCKIAQVAADNGDVEMFQAAQDKIHEIEARQRRVECPYPSK